MNYRGGGGVRIQKMFHGRYSRYRIKPHDEKELLTLYLFLVWTVSIWVLVANQIDATLIAFGVLITCMIQLQRQRWQTNQRYVTLNVSPGDIANSPPIVGKYRNLVTTVRSCIFHPLIGFTIHMTIICSFIVTVMAVADVNFEPGESSDFNAMISNVGVAAFILSVASGVIAAIAITVIVALPAIRIAATSRITLRPIKSPGPGTSSPLPNQTPRTQQQIRQDRIFGAIYTTLLVGAISSSSVAVSVFYLTNRTLFSSAFFIAAVVMIILYLLISIAIVMISPNLRTYIKNLAAASPTIQQP